ncbi:hypothetical protein HPP92_008789 [Vanilla planifolia]|uniref:Protein arginine methyltransferase NDUFAF7 n=1 Tax=Vanilla planifolia TaxID=51239 RepID=A0A835R921_VANPL|nr:hypothetical protein HPP92_008789 [Vanilla planifolia]
MVVVAAGSVAWFNGGVTGCSPTRKAPKMLRFVMRSTLLPLYNAVPLRRFPLIFFSTSFFGDNPLLVRDFIHAALYDPNHGYFSNISSPVGVLEKSIRFNQLQGRDAYLQYLDKVYKHHDIVWFTPVELFKPWYAYAIAEAILRTANLSVPLKGMLILILVGLYCWRFLTIFHMISSIAVIKFLHGWRFGLRKCRKGSLQVSETYRPLQDALISRCIHIVGLDRDEKANGRSFVSAARRIWSKAFPKPCQAWLPTGCLQLLEVLHWALPKMSLIASDFSYLPDVTIMGDRAPLVSTKKDGITVDHRSYLDAKGDSDIFFPTDFTLLERIDHHCSLFSREKKNTTSKSTKLRRSIILDTAAFMEEFGLPLKTKTKDGHNPLLDDFKNTKFYLSVPTHNMN